MTSISPKTLCSKTGASSSRFLQLVFLAGIAIIYSGCAGLQPVDLPDEKALEPAESEIWTALATQRPGNWFQLLNTGDEAIQWRLRLIDSATQSLDLQTFLWKQDKTGLLIIRHIMDAANRGVRVRILLDDTFTIGESEVIFDIDQHPNIEYRLYNPFGRRYDSFVLRQLMNIGSFSRLDHRMHNKVMISDNRTAILGGRNLADEYFGNHSEANFRDLELLAAGPIIQSISERFDDYWNSNWSIPVDRILDAPPSEKQLAGFTAWLEENVDRGLQENHATRHRMWLAVAQTAAPGEAILIADEPARERPPDGNELPVQLEHALIDWIERSEQEMVIVTAYLIPTPELEKAIERVEARGVQVRILTNSLRSNNHVAAHSAHRHHIKRLMEHGADLHEVRAEAKDRSLYMQNPVDEKHLGLHAKLILIDREHAFIGSANLDPRSLHLNTEMGLIIQSHELNRRLRQMLEVDFHRRNAWHLQVTDDGGIVWVADDMVLQSQPADSAFQLLEDWFIGILPIEEEM